MDLSLALALEIICSRKSKSLPLLMSGVKLCSYCPVGDTYSKGQDSRNPIIGPVNLQKNQIVCKPYRWSF